MVLGVSEGTHRAQTSLGSGVSLGAAFRNKNDSFPGITAKTKAWAANPWRTTLPLSSINAEHQNLLSEVRAALFLAPNPAPRALWTQQSFGVLRAPCGQQVTPQDTFTGQFPACGEQTFPLGMSWGALQGHSSREGCQRCCVPLAQGNSFWAIHVFLLGQEWSLPPSSTENFRESHQKNFPGLVLEGFQGWIHAGSRDRSRAWLDDGHVQHRNFPSLWLIQELIHDFYT